MRSALAAGCVLFLVACGGEEPAPSATEPRGLTVLEPADERPFYRLLGRVPEGEIARHTFRLENTDPEPLRVLRLQTACGCTTPSLRLLVPGREPESIFLQTPDTLAVVPPRGVLELELAIDTAHAPQKNTFWLATAHLTTDSPRSAYLHFELSIFVDAPLQVTPREVDFGDVPVNGGAWTKATAIRAVRSSTLRVVGISNASPELAAEIDAHESFGQPVWDLRIELPPGLPKGPYQGEVRLEVVEEGAEAEAGSGPREVLVPVRGRIVDDIIPRPALLSLGALTPGETARGEARVVSLVPGRRIVVHDARVEGVESDALSVELEPVTPDSLGRAQEWKVHLVVVGDLPRPRFAGSVRLAIEEAEGPSAVVLRFSGSYR